jgi:hypothetical protein
VIRRQSTGRNDAVNMRMMTPTPTIP